jgi:hypothetical protein
MDAACLEPIFAPGATRLYARHFDVFERARLRLSLSIGISEFKSDSTYQRILLHATKTRAHPPPESPAECHISKFQIGKSHIRLTLIGLFNTITNKGILQTKEKKQTTEFYKRRSVFFHRAAKKMVRTILKRGCFFGFLGRKKKGGIRLAKPVDNQVCFLERLKSKRASRETRTDPFTAIVTSWRSLQR